jgi:hypothetical protein
MATPSDSRRSRATPGASPSRVCRYFRSSSGLGLPLLVSYAASTGWKPASSLFREEILPAGLIHDYRRALQSITRSLNFKKNAVIEVGAPLSGKKRPLEPSIDLTTALTSTGPFAMTTQLLTSSLGGAETLLLENSTLIPAADEPDAAIEARDLPQLFALVCPLSYALVGLLVS